MIENASSCERFLAPSVSMRSTADETVRESDVAAELNRSRDEKARLAHR